MNAIINLKYVKKCRSSVSPFSPHLHDEVECLDGGDEGLVGEDDSLGDAGRSGGVHDDGRVGGRGRHGRQARLAAELAHLLETVQGDAILQQRWIGLPLLILNFSAIRQSRVHGVHAYA